MSYLWLIPLMIIGIALLWSLWFLAKISFGTFILIAYTRMDELDVMKIFASADYQNLAVALAKKLVETALLLNYEAIRLLKQLEKAEAIPHNVAHAGIEECQKCITRITEDSSQNTFRVALMRYRFKWNLRAAKKFSPAAASAIDAWQKLTKKQGIFMLMMSIYKNILDLLIKSQPWYILEP